MQHAPVNGNFPRPDAEEAAEIDDGGPHLSSVVNHDIDNTPHVVTIGALHGLAENGIGHIAIDHDRRHSVTGRLRRGRLR